MLLLPVRQEAIIRSGESHAETSLIGQTFPVQPSVPASWNRVGYMLFHVKSFNGLWHCIFIFWLFILFYEYACIVCMGSGSLHEHVCTHSCQRKMLDFFLYPTPLFSLEARSLTEPDTYHLGWTGWPERSLEITTISASASSPVLGLQAHITMPNLYIGPGDLNSHPSASIARAHYPLSHLSNPGTVVLKWWLDCLQPC